MYILPVSGSADSDYQVASSEILRAVGVHEADMLLTQRAALNVSVAESIGQA